MKGALKVYHCEDYVVALPQGMIRRQGLDLVDVESGSGDESFLKASVSPRMASGGAVSRASRNS